jgi:hypothetical protein
MSKNYNKNIGLNNLTGGPDRRKEIIDNIKDKGAYLPQSIFYDDMDRALIDFIDNDINMVVEGEKVPIFFLTLQRWSEFTKSWGSSDEYKDVDLPFISIVRDPDVQAGSNQQKFWNIPGKKSWLYMKVPTLTNGRVGLDHYKIPQPTPVDLSYKVRFFSNRIIEVNDINKIFQKKFDSRQHYITVKGHPIPLHLEAVSDDSKTDEMEARRYYIQEFEILMYGYLLDEEDFELVPTIDRSMLHLSSGGNSGSSPKIRKNTGLNDTVSYEVSFKRNTSLTSSIDINETISFNGVTKYNLEDVNLLVNNELQENFPFEVVRGDELTIKVTRPDGSDNSNSTLTINGVFV